jgi:membrane protein YqaA with SNARE-associated domain
LDIALKILLVIALGALELWVAIPAGFASGLEPVLVGIGAATGDILGTFMIIVIGERIRNWLISRRHKQKEENKLSLIQRIWQRYGVIGLGLLSPLLTGAPLGAALGISLGAGKRRLMVWMSVGIILWTLILTSGVALGIAGIEKWL